LGVEFAPYNAVFVAVLVPTVPDHHKVSIGVHGDIRLVLIILDMLVYKKFGADFISEPVKFLPHD